jgi:hypothetical protein
MRIYRIYQTTQAQLHHSLQLHRNNRLTHFMLQGLEDVEPAG